MHGKSITVLLSCFLCAGCALIGEWRHKEPVLSDPGALSSHDKQVLSALASGRHDFYKVFECIKPAREILHALEKLTAVEREQPLVPNGRYQATLIFAENQTTNASAPKLWFLLQQAPQPVILCFGEPACTGSYVIGSSGRISVAQTARDPLRYQVTNYSPTRK